MKVNRSLVLLIWVLIIGVLSYLYFFKPALFEEMFQYKGAGSPFINTPSGGGD